MRWRSPLLEFGFGSRWLEMAWDDKDALAIKDIRKLLKKHKLLDLQHVAADAVAVLEPCRVAGVKENPFVTPGKEQRRTKEQRNSDKKTQYQAHQTHHQDCIQSATRHSAILKTRPRAHDKEGKVLRRNETSNVECDEEGYAVGYCAKDKHGRRKGSRMSLATLRLKEYMPLSNLFHYGDMLRQGVKKEDLAKQAEHLEVAYMFTKPGVVDQNQAIHFDAVHVNQDLWKSHVSTVIPLMKDGHADIGTDGGAWEWLQAHPGGYGANGSPPGTAHVADVFFPEKGQQYDITKREGMERHLVKEGEKMTFFGCLAHCGLGATTHKNLRTHTYAPTPGTDPAPNGTYVLYAPQ